jgi:hypothetical protein
MLGDLQNLYLLMEDLQSSINQAKNILKNNQVENPENVLRDLENIYNGVEFEDDEHKGSRSDKDIVTLAFIKISGLSNDRIQSIYNQYCNTKSLYSTKFLSKWVDGVQNTIKNNKWFKPSEEKLQFIQEEVNKLVEEVHSKYVPPQNKITKSKYIPNEGDDVVFENDKIVIYLADSMDKCIYYGDPKLCISSSKKTNYYWRYRLGIQRDDKLGMSTYFVNWKDGSNKILVDSLGDEDGPANKYSWNDIISNTDMDISKEDLIEKYSDLKKPFDLDVFQFVPYGENEKRAYEINENVTSILDPELKTFDDYDIFIQMVGEVSDHEWDELEMDINTKKILFKKYLGTGVMVNKDIFDRYGSPKDLPWYEDIISRSLENSLIYYVSRDGNVENSKIIDNYDKELKRSNLIKDRYIVKDNKGQNSIIIRGNIHLLPNFSDREDIHNISITHGSIISLKGLPQKISGSFDCNFNYKLISLEGAPQQIGGNFKYSENKLTSLKGAPQEVGGSFLCSHNFNLTSLEGSPKKVGGGFYCSNNNNLISLEGAPQQVIGDFKCVDNFSFKSLKGAPQKVGGDFSCSGNKLKSLKYAPQEVGGGFNCTFNNLTSLEGAPQKVGDDVNCKFNGLISLEGAPQEVGGEFDCAANNLTSLKGAPQKIGRDFYCTRNNDLTSLEGAPKKIGGGFYSNLEYEGIQNDKGMREWGRNFGKALKISMEEPEEVIKESFTFQSLLERIMYIYSESVAKTLDRDIIHQLSRDMEQIEVKNFSGMYASSSDYLIDDSKMDGFIGYGLFDNDKIVGYIYGYRMGSDGEYDDVDIDPSDVNFHNQKFKQLIELHGFEKVCNPKNTFYVSNLVINKENRIGLTKILIPFLEDIKSKGYKFMVFDGLEDTLRLLNNKDRLNKMNLQILADVRDYDSSLVIISNSLII